MALNVQEVLKQIGWKNGFHIPMANKENQELISEFEKLMKRKRIVRNNYEESKSKLEMAEKHFKYIKEESNQNQKLLTDYERQLKTEQHNYLKLNGQLERTEYDVKQVRKNIEEITGRVVAKQIQLGKLMEKVEKVKISTRWDCEALKAWEDSINKKLNDEDVLKRYSKTDKERFKELEARREILQKELNDKREKAEKMTAEIQSYHRMQGKTDKLREEQQAERKLLIERWQNAVRNLRNRDKEIFETKISISEIEEATKRQQEVFKEEELFLRQQETLNKAIEDEINNLNLLHSRMREDLLQNVQFTVDFSTELNMRKRTLLTISNQFEQVRGQNKSLRNEIESHDKENQRRNKKLEDLQIKFEKSRTVSCSVTDHAEKLKEMIRFEEHLSKALARDIDKAQIDLYKNRDDLTQQTNIGKTIQQRISIATSSINNIHNLIFKEMHKINLQRELGYRLAYTKHQVEMKVSLYEGSTRTREENDIIDAKIKELEGNLAHQNEIKNFLQLQVNKVEEEMRKLTVDIAGDANRIERLRNKLEDEMVMYNGGAKQAAVAKMKAQQRQVEISLLQLKVSQLEKALCKEENSIYDLRCFKLSLETSLKERAIEISTLQQVLEIEKRNLDEQRTRLKGDIVRKKIRIEQFQKKHHLALTALGSGEDGQALSMEEVKMQEAEERRALKDEHEELAKKIKLTEKEIIAMENTLSVVNKTNEVFENILMPKDESVHREQSQIVRLQEEICDGFGEIKKRRKILGGNRKKLKELQENLRKIQEKWLVKRKDFEELENIYLKFTQDTAVRREKLLKILNSIKKYRRSIPDKNLIKPTKNLEIRQLEYTNKESLRQLAIFISSHDENECSIVRDYVEKYNLNLPPIGTKSTLSSSHSLVSVTTRSDINAPSRFASTCNLSQIIIEFDGNSN